MRVTPRNEDDCGLVSGGLHGLGLTLSNTHCQLGSRIEEIGGTMRNKCISPVFCHIFHPDRVIMPWHTRVMLGGDGRVRGKLLEKDVLTFVIQLLWQPYKLITFCLMDLETRN